MKTQTKIFKTILLGVIIITIGLSAGAINKLQQLNLSYSDSEHLSNNVQFDQRDTSDIAYQESATRTFILEFEETQEVDYTIYNEYGEIVQENEINALNGKMDINVSKLDNGIYYLELETKRETKNMQFIK